MIISSIALLMNHRIFRILAVAQAIMDDEEQALTHSPMTRSPFQLLALLLMWLMLENNSKDQVITKLNQIIQKAAKRSSMEVSTQVLLDDITVNDLNFLSGQIDWISLAEELNSSPESFFCISLPDVWIDHSRQHGILKLFSKVIIPTKFNCIIIHSTLHQQLEWLKPFDNWILPQNTYTLSPMMIEALKSIKTQLLADPESTTLHSNIGTFCILATKKEVTVGFDNLATDTYELSIESPKDSAGVSGFKVQLDRTVIGLGLYSAFKNVTLVGGGLVKDIRVEVSGKSCFNTSGVSVAQEQIVHQDTAFPNDDKQPNTQQIIAFEILVKNIYALFESLNGLDYSTSNDFLKTVPMPDDNPYDIFIVLRGFTVKPRETLSEWNKSDAHAAIQLKLNKQILCSSPDLWQQHMHEVRLYPRRLSHSAVIGTLPALLSALTPKPESKIEHKPETKSSATVGVKPLPSSAGFYSKTPVSDNTYNPPALPRSKPGTEMIEFAPYCTLL